MIFNSMPTGYAVNDVAADFREFNAKKGDNP